MGPSEARACCVFHVAGALCSRNTSPGTRKLPLSSERGTVPPVQSLGLRQLGEPLGKSTGSQSQPLPSPPPPTELGLSSGHGGRAVRRGSSQRTRRDRRREPRPGLIHTSGSPCVREPRPRHPPGSGLPLQLTDFQMKAEISCALDLEVVSWMRPSSSSAGP